MPRALLLGAYEPTLQRLHFHSVVRESRAGYDVRMESGRIFPDKPIRIVAAQPGAENDFAARVIAQGLTKRLGRQVNVENHPGGSAGAMTVLAAERDGCTLLSADTQTIVEPFLHDTRYDVSRDFAPVIAVINVPFILYAHPSVPADSVEELIALLKAQPGALQYGSGLSGASGHLAMELFKAMAGVDISRVAYKGGAAATRGLVAGEVQLIFTSANVGAEYVKSGRLKALAGPSGWQSALFPGLPALEKTVPGYETKQVYGMLAPAGTPAPIIKLLNEEMAQVLKGADVKKRILAAGDQCVGGSPEDYAACIAAQTAKWGRVIRAAGIRAE